MSFVMLVQMNLNLFFLLLKIVGPPYFAVWVEQYFNCDGGGASVTAKH